MSSSQTTGELQPSPGIVVFQAMFSVSLHVSGSAGSSATAGLSAPELRPLVDGGDFGERDKRKREGGDRSARHQGPPRKASDTEGAPIIRPCGNREFDDGFRVSQSEKSVRCFPQLIVLKWVGLLAASLKDGLCLADTNYRMVSSVIVIARSDQAVGLRKRLGNESGVMLFSDAESLKALEAILAGPPRILALDRSFVATARAAALVARVKAEPNLRGTDVRVLAEDEMHLPVLLNARMPGFEGALVRASYPLDYCGTRRAPRFVTSPGVNVSVNGKSGRLVNVSCIGAQVAAALRLRPEEPVRIALVDPQGEVKLKGVVAWSVAEPVDGAMCYRAGVEFLEPDSMTLEGFCARNIARPDRTPSAA